MKKISYWKIRLKMNNCYIIPFLILFFINNKFFGGNFRLAIVLLIAFIIILSFDSVVINLDLLTNHQIEPPT